MRSQRVTSRRGLLCALSRRRIGPNLAAAVPVAAAVTPTPAPRTRSKQYVPACPTLPWPCGPCPAKERVYRWHRGSSPPQKRTRRDLTSQPRLHREPSDGQSHQVWPREDHDDAIRKTYDPGREGYPLEGCTKWCTEERDLELAPPEDQQADLRVPAEAARSARMPR